MFYCEDVLRSDSDNSGFAIMSENGQNENSGNTSLNVPPIN